MKSSWVASEVRGWAGYVILAKLRNLRWVLKKWNNEVFRNVAHSVKVVESDLHNLDLLAESRELSNVEVDRRRQLRKEVWLLNKKQEWLWLQKFRLNWSMMADRNTRFFHIVVSRRQSRNLLNSVSVAVGLEARFAEEEVWAAVKSCDGNKALGGVNSSFITLIPKVEGLVSISEYRPISLIGSIYKILARNILDGVLIANEVVDWWKRSGQSGLILKLDFEKAYDSVSSNCLLSMMSRFGFGIRWRKWIQECVCTPRVSVLVNGSPTAEFSPEKGLRQGDPLSPFLFNLVAEGLNMLIQRAGESGLIIGAVIGQDGSSTTISHLQFSDDTIIFCKADVGEMVKDCAGVLNCRNQSLPLVYLGLPLGASPRLKKTWKTVIDKIRAKLASWKRKLLSFRGCLTFIRSVLSSLPVYYLSIFKMPQYVIKTIDCLRAAFLWGGSELRRKIHLVKWEEITKIRDQGGLGIRRLKDVNECLLAKWWWRFCVEDKSLWKRVLCSMNQYNGRRWSPFLCYDEYLSKVWGGSVGQSNPQLKSIFLDNVELVVGNGGRTQVWMGHWCGHQCLMEKFPRLYNLSTEKRYNFKCIAGEEKIIKGLGTKFSKSVVCLGGRGVGKSFCSEHWSVMLQSGSTESSIPWNDVESINHVLLWCPFVWKVWSIVLNWWGLQWVLPGNVERFLHWWMGFKWRKFEARIWKVIPLAVIWFTWKLINKVVFTGK
ncbi:uncharacterized protein LOC114296820 [Camellia sinensis]|uniref:uncharacterized protein LOC114296820 n=1 Tax=Camellia sinensis TaxID=4442 RepID=UPI0010358284|nr:uncharacterized protein LOC114296820 [Camellia sinensis]